MHRRRPGERRAEHLAALTWRAWLAAPLCLIPAAALAASAAGASAAPATSGSQTAAVIAFVPAPVGVAFETQLERADGMSVAIMSASEGGYAPAQLALDVSQGARISSAAYSTPRPPPLSLAVAGAGGLVRGWPAARERAEHAPQLLRPGLLASQVSGGGAAYAAVTGSDHADAPVAADGAGRIGTVSLGSAATLPARVRALLALHPLVVCELPGGGAGAATMAALARERGQRELLVVVGEPAAGTGGELAWAGVAGLGARHELSSRTTNQRGLISAIDLDPTVLRHLGLTRLPADMRGAPIHTDAALHSGSLRSLMARLRVIGPRRLKALAFVLCGWAALLLLAGLAPLAARDRLRASALRAGALGVLWAPAVSLLSAALAPNAAAEFALITLACLGLGALNDALLRWPLGPIAPAIVTLAAFSVDALAHLQLLIRALPGPNPILGARFFGIGNELKSGLAVLVLAAAAAAVGTRVGRTPADRAHPASSRGAVAAATLAAAGALLAAIEGWARIGAAVGGVVLVCAGTAVATVMLLPGSLTRRRALAALAAPLAGLVLLALLDLATAHGSGHFTGSVLHARSAGDIRDLIVRRYGGAWRELGNHAMPAATAIALVCAALGLRHGERLLRPVRGNAVWRAALTGGLAAGVVGALVEDSGPVLLVVAVFALGCVLGYLWGAPRPPASSGSAERAARHLSLSDAK
jgi:hypothetical protein